MQRIIAPADAEEKKAKIKVPEGKVWLLPEKGNLYKINMHAHSKISDGGFTPEELKKLYMAEGYSAVAFTDHRKCVPHPELTDENFVALTGTELDFNPQGEDDYGNKVVHINAIARDSGLSFEKKSMALDFDIINDTIKELNDMNCIVTVNHPVFSNMSTEDLFRIKGAYGMEVVNGVSVGFNNYSDDSAFYEYYLRGGGKAVPIGSDDCHGGRFPDGTPFVDYFQGFTVVKAPELTYDALINGMDNNHLFASTGPMFENLWIEGDMLHVQCSAVSGVYVHTKYVSYKASDIENSDCLTDVAIDISKLRAISPYIWVQLRDTKGKKAWAMPYWF